MGDRTSVTLLELLYNRYGASMTLEDAARELSYPTAAAARIALVRGVFPVPVRRRGAIILVAVSAVVAYLENGVVLEQNMGSQRPKPVAIPGKRGRGRPRKCESPVVPVPETLQVVKRARGRPRKCATS